MAGAVVAEDVGRLARLLRWCGLALIVAGVLMVVATRLHPSRDAVTGLLPAVASYRVKGCEA
jgi:hypothetical protein